MSADVISRDAILARHVRAGWGRYEIMQLCAQMGSPLTDIEWARITKLAREGRGDTC